MVRASRPKRRQQRKRVRSSVFPTPGWSAWGPLLGGPAPADLATPRSFSLAPLLLRNKLTSRLIACSGGTAVAIAKRIFLGSIPPFPEPCPHPVQEPFYAQMLSLVPVVLAVRAGGVGGGRDHNIPAETV